MKWTPEADGVLRRIGGEGGSYQDAADALDVTRMAAAGRAYRLGIKFAYSGPRRGSGTRPARRFYDARVEQMRSVRRGGATYREIGAAFGVDSSYAFRLIKGPVSRQPTSTLQAACR